MEVKKTKTANRRRRKGGEVVVNGKGKKPGRESGELASPGKVPYL